MIDTKKIALAFSAFLLGAGCGGAIGARAQALYGTTNAPLDPSLLMTRAEALASISTLNGRIDAIAPYARVKWAGQNLSTNTSGVWTGTVPAGRMTTGISVSGVVVHTVGQFSVPNVTAVGSPAAGYTVTVTFAKAKTSITVPAVVVGSAAVSLPLFETQANVGVVSFDIGFSEPDVIGS